MDQEGLIRNNIIVPKSNDWRVRFFFVDGSTKVIRVAPGKISEEKGDRYGRSVRSNFSTNPFSIVSRRSERSRFRSLRSEW
jgi:hypothetical protein